MQKRLLRRSEGELDPELGRQTFEHALEGEEVRGLATASPRPRRQEPYRDPRKPVRLGKRCRPISGELALSLEIDAGGFKEGEGARAASGVPGGRNRARVA